MKKPRSSNAFEGDTVIIYCEVVGDPQPQVAWLRDFLKVSDGFALFKILDRMKVMDHVIVCFPFMFMIGKELSVGL